MRRREHHEDDREGCSTPALVVAVCLAAGVALQHCYDPAKAPPIDPSPTSTVSPEVMTSQDAAADARR